MNEQHNHTVHVLQRLNWACPDVSIAEGLMLLPGRVRLQSFDDAAAAERVCDEKNNALRAIVNPFRCNGPALQYQSSLDGERLHDWVLDVGLVPPRVDASHAEWAQWWHEQSPSMSALQRLKLWQAFDRLRFYEVVERPRRPLLYLVVQINWSYNDEWYTAEAEGGKTFEAYRDREAALVHCEDANQHAHSVWGESIATNTGDENSHDFDMSDRWQSLEERHLHPFNKSGPILQSHHEVPFWEVIEVELEE